MHYLSSRFPVRTGICLAILALQSALSGPSFAEAGGTPARTPVTLNFVNADIEAVARAMASMTGRQVVIDPRVKGTINLSSDEAMSPARAYNQFLAALRLQGFTVVRSAGLDKVVPEAEAKLQSEAVAVSGPGNADGTGSGRSAVVGSSNQIVTQIFKLNFENANSLLPILRPLISPNNVINVNPTNNSLVITDYADNLQRVARIIAASDVANGTDLEIVNLKYAVATDLAPLLLRLIDSGGGSGGANGNGNGAVGTAGGADNSFKTTIIAEPRSNALIVRAANPARIALVKSLVSRLDQPTVQGDGGTGNIHVIYLKNADASKLAGTLRAVLSGEQRTTSAATLASSANANNGAGNGASGGANGSSSPTGGGMVQADVPTNSLIITAPDPQYRQLRAVIDQLDARRAQVYIESLIAEVNATRAAQFGIQWQGPVSSTTGGSVGVMGTNYGTSGSNIISLAAGLTTGAVTPAAGFNFGVGSQINGNYTLTFLAQVLETQGDGNVLSTPNLMTLDNEEAKIVVGQNVPFLTGQYTSSSSSSSTVSPFQTIERKDVGITLKVRPQISENGTVHLTIFQEVSSVDSSSVGSSTGLITNKRSIESNVVVQDGQIVVLGGLLSDTYASSSNRVPGLADIPIIGNFFKSDTRSRQKTNLMVFLRPVVLRDAASSDAMAQSRYDDIRGAQQAMQPVPSAVMPISGAAVLPERPPAKSMPVPTPVPVQVPAAAPVAEVPTPAAN